MNTCQICVAHVSEQIGILKKKRDEMYETVNRQQPARKIPVIGKPICNLVGCLVKLIGLKRSDIGKSIDVLTEFHKYITKNDKREDRPLDDQELYDLLIISKSCPYMVEFLFLKYGDVGEHLTNYKYLSYPLALKTLMHLFPHKDQEEETNEEINFLYNLNAIYFEQGPQVIYWIIESIHKDPVSENKIIESAMRRTYPSTVEKIRYNELLIFTEQDMKEKLDDIRKRLKV